MSLRKDILSMVQSDPVALRNLLTSDEVNSALNSIGVLLQVFELHAPSESSRKASGLGPTLCGIRGRRHSIVTCSRCQKAQSKT